MNSSAKARPEQRTITNLITQVQDAAVRDGLNAFSLAGPLGRFLDADHDVLLEGQLRHLRARNADGDGTESHHPGATYLFHRIEQRLDGRPTLIIIDEAWVMLANSIFGAKLEEWLRTLRKKNAAVVLATQSLSEIANSPHRDVILESCPTKLYLPNAEAQNAASRELYRQFGLSDRQIDIVAEATPKRHYYYVSPLGRRLFQFSLGPAALAFIGAGSKDDVLSARRMIEHRRALARRVASHSRFAGLGRVPRELFPQPDPPVVALIGANGNSFHANGKLNQREIRQ